MSSKYDYSNITNPDPNEPSLLYGPLTISIGQWRTKMWGKDVREAGARCWESISVQLNQFNALVNRLAHGYDDLQKQINEIALGTTKDGELKQARVSLDDHIYPTLKDRLDADQIETGIMGDPVGEDDETNESLYIEGLDEADSPFDWEVTSTSPEDEIPFGIETIQAKDLEIEPSGKENS